MTQHRSFLRTHDDREDWDLTWNVALETGSVLVGKRIRIGLNIQDVASRA